MQNNRFWQGVKRAYTRYDRLMEKQGFYIVLGVCVLVILLSAFYTFRLRNEMDSVAVTDESAQSASGMDIAQTLQEAQALIESQGAQAPLALPTQSPLAFTQPLGGFTDRIFSDTEPQYFSQSSAWQVHAGIDLQADYGAQVAACAAGTVLSVWLDNEMGLCVRISHAGGYESLYAGLSDASYVKAGDPVAQGQVIGHVGNGVLAESDAQPHLHLEIWLDGRPIDPLSVFLGLDK